MIPGFGGEVKYNESMAILYLIYNPIFKAFKVEKMVLQTLKKRFTSGFVSKENMPQGGFSETFDASQTSSTKIIRTINRAIKNSGN